MSCPFLRFQGNIGQICLSLETFEHLTLTLIESHIKYFIINSPRYSVVYPWRSSISLETYIICSLPCRSSAPHYAGISQQSTQTDKKSIHSNQPFSNGQLCNYARTRLFLRSQLRSNEFNYTLTPYHKLRLEESDIWVNTQTIKS